jgi:hypothetical protein
MKDYILFIHGVNTREETEKPDYADELFDNIQNCIKKIAPSSKLQLKKAPLYWGEEGKEVQNHLIKDFENSEVFEEFWFKNFRKKQLLQFAGDAAMYISRTVGSEVVQKLKKDAETFLSDYEPGDRLHLVTHSWGTVILFDILFADRWDNQKVPAYQDVQFIRNKLYGVEPDVNNGIHLSSVHTMGSPIALFSLISVNGSSHDFSPKLEKLLKYLHENGLNGKQLPWQNFAHPGDPIAWPLRKTISRILHQIDPRYLPDVQDIITTSPNDFLFQLVSQNLLAILNGGSAHGSYWQNKKVAEKIAQSILDSSETQ